jgi:phage terminase small subunit
MTTRKTATYKPSNRSTKNTLTPKREKFVEGYARHGNATKAAREAGYTHPNVQAAEILRDTKVRERIEARRKQAMEDAQVHTNEVIGTLVSHMRADITDLMNEDGEIDFQTAQEGGVSHLIKEYSVRRTVNESGESVTRTVKLHDSQTAAKALCDVFGLKQEPRQNLQNAEAKRKEVQESIERIRAVHGDEAAERYRQSLLEDDLAGKYVN